MPTWFLAAGGQRQLERGEKIEAQTLRDLALKVARCPASCPFSNWCARVRIQEPGHTIQGSGSRGGSGEARRPARAEPFLAVSSLPRPAEPGRRSLAGPEGGRDLRPDPGAPHVRKVRHFYQLPAHREFAVPRTTLSLGASGLVWPEDFFFFFKTKVKKNVVLLTQWSLLAPQPPLVLSPFFFEVTETKEGHRRATILQ